jgi:hypothetical protein
MRKFTYLLMFGVMLFLIGCIIYFVPHEEILVTWETVDENLNPVGEPNVIRGTVYGYPLQACIIAFIGGCISLIASACIIHSRTPLQ